MTDEKIIELLKANKTDKAFYKLYADFPKIQKMILRKGGSKNDAQDIFQEALIVFYRKVTETDFKLTSKIGTYLYSVSRFLWKDEMAKNKKRNYKELPESLSENELQELEELAEKETKLKAVEAVLQTISKKCKEIFELFYFKSCSMKEIAAKMNYTSERIARTQKYKCMEQAKKKIVV
jgi:RNA polymerase sigma factor (sigma-70 family)